MTNLATSPEPVRTADASPAPPRRLTYRPGLDGLRGVAVAVVLFFHGGFEWAVGGFLGVSVFFTLSGYLITSLLITEQAARDTISLGAFWGRRVRRLLPASLAAVAGVVVLTATVLDEARADLAGDVAGALLNVANWRFYFADQSYADLFAAPSPLIHFWSLAIEEQFYLLFPLLMYVLLARLRLSTPVLGVVFAAGFALATLAAVLVGPSNPDLAYYATFTRAAELLGGCLLAVLVGLARSEHPSVAGGRVRSGLGVVAAVVLLVLVHGTSQQDSWLYHGGLPAFTLVSMALVSAAIVPGPVRWLLSLRPLVWLGMISYGVYLYHWPIFQVLTPVRTGWSAWPLFAARIAVTLAVAVISFVLLERPIRHGRRFTRPSLLLVPLCAGLLIFTGAVFVGRRALPPPAFAEGEGTDVTLPAPETTPAPRLVVYGDSTARADAVGLIDWSSATGDAVVSNVGTANGCGYVRDGDRKVAGQPEPISKGCRDHLDSVADKLGSQKAGVAVLIGSSWDVSDHRVDGGPWMAPGDAAYDDVLRRDLTAVTDRLLDSGAEVVWVSTPITHQGWGMVPDYPDKRERIDRYNEIMRQVAESRPGAAYVGLDEHLGAAPDAPLDDPDVRPDGVHFTPEAARRVADWLGPEVLRVTGT